MMVSKIQILLIFFSLKVDLLIRRHSSKTVATVLRIICNRKGVASAMSLFLRTKKSFSEVDLLPCLLIYEVVLCIPIYLSLLRETGLQQIAPFVSTPGLLKGVNWNKLGDLPAVRGRIQFCIGN